MGTTFFVRFTRQERFRNTCYPVILQKGMHGAVKEYYYMYPWVRLALQIKKKSVHGIETSTLHASYRLN